jgi:hypothetical protein
VRGKFSSGANKWEKRMGLKEGTFRRTRQPRAKGAEEAKARFQAQLQQGVAIPIEGRYPAKANMPIGWEEDLEGIMDMMIEEGVEDIQSAQQQDATEEELEERAEAVRRMGERWRKEDERLRQGGRERGEDGLISTPQCAQDPDWREEESEGGRERKAGGHKPNNVSPKEVIEFWKLAKDPRRWILTKADKGGKGVLMTRAFAREEARKHVRDEGAYVRAGEFAKRLREFDSQEGARWLEGAMGEDGERRKWRSTLDFLVPAEGGEPRGDWETEEGMISSLLARMEFFLAKGMGSKLPGEVIAELTFRKPPNASKGKERWGLTEEDESRRQGIRAVILEVICKLHKKVFATRPVARAFASVMKPWEKLLGTMLVEITREDEEGEEEILLDESRLFVKKLEELNAKWQDEGATETAGFHEDEVVEFVSWDITAMYPNLKHGFVIREIDEAIMRVIRKKEGGERKKKEALREVLMPMLIFALQHQFLYVLSDEKGKDGDEEKIFYYQFQGIYIGSSASGAIANLALLGGEREMLRDLRMFKGASISLYRRYIDDIGTIIEGNKEWVRKVGEMMQTRINMLDEEEGSVKVDPASVIRAVKGWEEGSEPVNQEYLDLDIGLDWGEEGWIKLETGIYRKPAAADNYLHFESAHPEALKRGMVRGELCRFLTRCSKEELFEKSWMRFRRALETRGYPGSWLDHARGGLKWSDREGMIAGMDKKRALKREQGPHQGGCNKAVVVVVASKPGVEKWWNRCRAVGGLLDLEGLNPEVRERLPKRLMLCLSRTQNQGGQMKAAGKRKRDKERREA